MAVSEKGTALKTKSSIPQERVVKGLVLGETLGKGTFGYVKLGIKQETGHKFALKFLRRDAPSFREDIVKKEIECMKKIRHKNVVGLLASTMKCKYPREDGGFDPTVLMVLEYANGGDLYDVIFYAGAMDEALGRTYFSQLLHGLDAIHKAGITHRDLKPNNILIDHKFILKITDFGLSHIGNAKEDPKAKRMKTTWVGTKGYRAPELVLKARYTNKIDVFALGVCLFVMLCARQPFKCADANNDPWYKCVAAKQYARYWKSHRSVGVSEKAKDFIQGLLAYQPRERLNIGQALEHDWMKQPMIAEADLPQHMIEAHKLANKKKMADPDRAARLLNSEAGAKRADDTIFEKHVVAEIDHLGGNFTNWAINKKEKSLAQVYDYVVNYCESQLQAEFEHDEKVFKSTGKRAVEMSDSEQKVMQLQQKFYLSIVQRGDLNVFSVSFDRRAMKDLKFLAMSNQVIMIVLDALSKEGMISHVYEEAYLAPKEEKSYDNFDFKLLED